MTNIEWLEAQGFVVATDGAHASIVRLPDGDPHILLTETLNELIQGIRDRAEQIMFEEQIEDAKNEYARPEIIDAY
jgi:hypothetical protein